MKKKSIFALQKKHVWLEKQEYAWQPETFKLCRLTPQGLGQNFLVGNGKIWDAGRVLKTILLSFLIRNIYKNIFLLHFFWTGTIIKLDKTSTI